MVLFWYATGLTMGISMVKQHAVIFKKWMLYVTRYNIQQDYVQRTKQKKHKKLLIIIATLCIIYHVISSILYTTDLRFEIFGKMWMLPFIDKCENPVSIRYRCFAALVFTAHIASSVFVIAQFLYVMLIIHGIRDEFQHYNTDFQTHISTTNVPLKATFDGDIEEWRIRHLELCQLVECVDEGYGLIHSNIFCY